MAGSATLSMILSAEEKAKQDNHDLEVCFGEELDLQKHFDGCKKNPGHLDFIPCSILKVLHLVNARLPDVLKLKKFCDYVTKLTVKLKVQYVSSQRVKVKKYPLSMYSGQRISSYGSGCVTDIVLSGDEGSFPCPLKNCPHLSEPHPVYGYIIITTAAHVVFDNEEAKETIVEFFYDDPNAKTNLKTAHGVSVRKLSIDGDFCELMCIVHSKSLFEEFAQMVSPRPTHPDIFQFADDTECKPTFLSLLSALADIRDCCKHHDSIESHFKDMFPTVIYEVKRLVKYDTITSRSIRANGNKVRAFLLEAEKVTKQQGLSRKVMASLLSDTINCECKSSEDVIEKVAILGVVNLISVVPRHNSQNMFVQYFFSQIVDCLNHVTHWTYFDTQVKDKIVVHVSHPHGQSKQVSLGNYSSISESDGLRKHIYKAPTCNGCSGGPVWILSTGGDGKILWNQVYGVPHKGCLDKFDKLNHSCSVEYSVPHLQKFCEILQIRPFKHLQNIRHYQHLMNIGPDPQTVICYTDAKARRPDLALLPSLQKLAGRLTLPSGHSPPILSVINSISGNTQPCLSSDAAGHWAVSGSAQPWPVSSYAPPRSASNHLPPWSASKYLHRPRPVAVDQAQHHRNYINFLLELFA